MKIVDIAGFYTNEGGGVKTYINNKLKAGKKAGHEIVIIAPGPENKEEVRFGGKIIWVKGPALIFDPRYYILYRKQTIKKILDKEKPDVIEGSTPWQSAWFAASWKGDAVKAFIFHQDPVAVYPQTSFGHLIGTKTVDYLFFWYWAYLRLLSRRFDATIVSGHWLANKLKGFNIQKPIAIPFGINKSRFSPSNKNDKIRKELLNKCGVSENGKLIITISRFHPEKRIPMLIKAFKIAKEKHPDIGYVIFGDGPFKNAVKSAASKVPNIHIAGFTPDRNYLSAALASTDFMIHGSSAETYGLVVAEAICSGIPIVVPDIGGAHDLASPDYAEIYKSGSTNECSKAILRMLARDKKDIKDIKDAIFQKTNSIGTMDDHFVNLFNVYEKLVIEKKERLS